jgi:hypothetical protein
MIRRKSAARPAMEKHGWLAARFAGSFEVNAVPIANIEQARFIRGDGRVKRSQSRHLVAFSEA